MFYTQFYLLSIVVTIFGAFYSLEFFFFGAESVHSFEAVARRWPAAKVRRGSWIRLHWTHTVSRGPISLNRFFFLLAFFCWPAFVGNMAFHSDGWSMPWRLIPRKHNERQKNIVDIFFFGHWFSNAMPLMFGACMCFFVFVCRRLIGRLLWPAISLFQLNMWLDPFRHSCYSCQLHKQLIRRDEQWARMGAW